MDRLFEEDDIEELIKKAILATLRDNYSGLDYILEKLDHIIIDNTLSRDQSIQVLRSWLIELHFFQFAKSNLHGFTEQFTEVLLQLAIKVNSFRCAKMLMEYLEFENNIFVDPYVTLAIIHSSKDCLELLLQYLDSPDTMLILERTDILTVALANGKHDMADFISETYFGTIDTLPKLPSGYICMTEQISSLSYIIKSKSLNDLETLNFVRKAYEIYGAKVNGIQESFHDAPIISAIKRGSLPLIEYLLVYLDKTRLDPIELIIACIRSQTSLFGKTLILELFFDVFEDELMDIHASTKELINAILEESTSPQVELLKYFINKGMSIDIIEDTCFQTGNQYIIDKLRQD